jgi:hypothetical protein
MRKCLLATVLLFGSTVCDCPAADKKFAVEKGPVVEVTPDAVTIDENGIKKLTARISDELLANDASDYFYITVPWKPAKITEVKKGRWVILIGEVRNGKFICFFITLHDM